MNRKVLLIAGLLLSMTLAGCGAKAEPPATAPAQAAEGEVTVAMKALKFAPAKLTVKKGTRITFINNDGMVHDVIQSTVKGLGKEQPGFNSGVIKPGDSWTVTMEKPGTYPILCSQLGHYTAGMVGTITVVE